VKKEAVIEARDADTIYAVPILMSNEGLDEVVLKKLDLPTSGEPQLQNWKDFLSKLQYPKKEVNIGLIGKYVELKDSYKSIAESFIHAGAANELKVNIRWIHSESYNSDEMLEQLQGLHGILVAPGFGDRGFDGKLAAVRYARENEIPFFGICLGMQAAVIEFARNVLGFEDANSSEMDPNSTHPVIDLMDEQKNVTAKGGTMRLGAYDCSIKEGTKAFEVYKRKSISERHRHRFELNNKYIDQLEEKGMIASGRNPENQLVEIVEIPEHPWFVGVQFHPEYKSTVVNPHPLFVDFVRAALKRRDIENN
jgi:CTP synthase